MALDPKQVTWDTGSNSNSLAAGATEDSDTMTGLSAAALDRAIMCKADNNGTPSAGDEVSFWLKPTLGDPDGAGADEFPTDDHAIFLCRLDTNADDPAIMTVPLAEIAGTAWEDFIVFTENHAATNAITCSATLLERT